MKAFFLFLSVVWLCFSFKNPKTDERSDKEIETILSSLSFDQKAGQLFISFFHGSTLDETTKKFIEKSHLGNFLYFPWANELANPIQVKKLSDELYDFVCKTNQLPPLICIDQEGGVVCRLTQGYSRFPGNMALGVIQDEALAEKVGRAIAKELKQSGIHLNFAPVVDVNSNPQNPVIGVRSFSNDPCIVARLAKQMILGFHEENIGATLKHFPGHGDTTLNPHTHLPVVEKTVQELQTIEFFPFESLKNETDCIMTAHVVYPSLDEIYPATLSSKILKNLLRDSMGYQGVVISDSLMMRGVSPEQSSFDTCVASVSKATVMAFNAGCDLMIVSKAEWADFVPTREQDEELIVQVVENFKRAVQEGVISKERFDASLKRVLRLKAKYARKNTKSEEIRPSSFQWK